MNFRFQRLKPTGCLLLLFLPVYTAFAGGKQQTHNLLQTQAGESQLAAPAEPAALYETPQTMSRAEVVFRAFAEAYPDRIGKLEYLDGDWTIEVYGERFYYAEGRFLPASIRDKAGEYNPHPFYGYFKELPPWTPLTKDESAMMKEQEARRSQRPPRRSPHFYDTLWRAHNREEAWEHIKQIRFLGHPILVHYSILTQISLVEEKILRLAKTDAEVRQWINNLKNLESWNWRNIAASQSRSYHAYGAAIDLLPKSLGGLETYWLWTANSNPEWWNVPYNRRFHPPAEVISAFEDLGFIWGGKWRYYDTMHFEYRPEILVLSGIGIMSPRDLR